MHELKPYKKEIKKYFWKIIEKYNFTIRCVGSHGLLLISKKCIIEMSTERYQPSVAVALISPENKNVSVALIEVLKQQGLMGKKILTNEEIAKTQAIEDEVEKRIYNCSIMLERYCQDVLNGSYFDKLQESGEKPAQ